MPQLAWQKSSLSSGGEGNCIELAWQKSSFSTGGEGECVELAAATPDRIHLRESDHPHEIATTTPRALTNLLHTIKAGTFSR